MIFIPYFSNYSITTTNYSGDQKFMASKSAEMIGVLYSYIRHYSSKDEYIYILDNASTVAFDKVIHSITEPIQFLSKNDYKIDLNKKVHIKQLNNHQGIRLSWSRFMKDFLLCAYSNYCDFLLLDMDMTYGYDLVSDVKNSDFCSHSISLYGRSIASIVTYISAFKLHEYDSLVKLPDFINYVEENFGDMIQYGSLYGEGATYRNFCHGKIAGIKHPELMIHQPNRNELLNFFEQHPIKNKFVSNFINSLKNNVNIP